MLAAFGFGVPQRNVDDESSEDEEDKRQLAAALAASHAEESERSLARALANSRSEEDEDVQAALTASIYEGTEVSSAYSYPQTGSLSSSRHVAVAHAFSSAAAPIEDNSNPFRISDGQAPTHEMGDTGRQAPLAYLLGPPAPKSGLLRKGDPRRSERLEGVDPSNCSAASTASPLPRSAVQPPLIENRLDLASSTPCNGQGASMFLDYERILDGLDESLGREDLSSAEAWFAELSHFSSRLADSEKRSLADTELPLWPQSRRLHLERRCTEAGLISQSGGNGNLWEDVRGSAERGWTGVVAGAQQGWEDVRANASNSWASVSTSFSSLLSTSSVSGRPIEHRGEEGRGKRRESAARHRQ